MEMITVKGTLYVQGELTHNFKRKDLLILLLLNFWEFKDSENLN